MLEDENTARARIDTFTYEDWKPLLSLIPEIEAASEFGEWAGGTPTEEGHIQFGYCVPAPVVSSFMNIVYDIPIIIAFDWPHWDEGRKLANDPEADLDSTDLVTRCKLITAIVRNDRFFEGALVSAFESGFILRLLKSIERSVTPEGKPR
ncbi:MAG: hypothetical protein GF388_04010 [Candidatus Aegiribacteria sp.]|nr:hypothetical protein [Candidatus Aegiribacteria sp.]